MRYLILVIDIISMALEMRDCLIIRIARQEYNGLFLELSSLLEVC